MNEGKTLKTLYLCYFGLREPLVQTQVLPYLRQLSASGEVEVFLLTFEPDKRRAWSASEETQWRAALARDGIRWFSLPYHKSPSALVTPYDIVRGAWEAARLARRYRIDVLHARGHLPMAMALLARRRANVRLLFDIRGLLAEEYEEAGVWTKNSPQFRAVRAVERAGLRRAAQLVVLTRRLRDRLVEHKLACAERIEVIPCCVDFARFEATHTENGDARRADESETRANGKNFAAESKAETLAATKAGRFEVVSAGSVTGLYLLEEMGRFFLALKRHRPDAFLRILTMSSAQAATATLEGVGLRAEDFWIGAVKPAEVPAYLRRAGLGLSLRKATFSQIAASPTKIPEYLAAGLPTVCNAGIGDTDEILTRERVGVIIRNFEAETLDEAARAALALTDEAEVSARCVEVAHRYFDLASVGGVGYRNAYRRLAAEGARAASETP
ncbi:MAG TPA: glycosyltransferase [Pyrinomonadaceae bacterium]|jgi:glycosyltransferase involved in cell wall biosynthesis